LTRAGTGQLSFVFADSPQGGGRAEATDVSEVRVIWPGRC